MKAKRQMRIVELVSNNIITSQEELFKPVSYTHLDVYKRQGTAPGNIEQISTVNNTILPFINQLQKLQQRSCFQAGICQY